LLEEEYDSKLLEDLIKILMILVMLLSQPKLRRDDELTKKGFGKRD